MELLSVIPRSLDFTGVALVTEGVLGTELGRGGGGDLYLGEGFGLPLGDDVFDFGDDFALVVFEEIVLSDNSLGIGGTGGTPFCPIVTTRDFRLEVLLVSRYTVLGEGWPDEDVPEVDDPIPESVIESRFDVGDGEGVREPVVLGFNVGNLVIDVEVVNFFSKLDAVKLGRGSSSLTMIVCAWL
jgi:hypothetical protein